MSEACNHEWVSIGCSTVCDPPVFHSACGKCRTFRHQKFYDDRDGADKDGKISDEWFDKEWFGPWDWKDFDAEHRTK